MIFLHDVYFTGTFLYLSLYSMMLEWDSVNHTSLWESLIALRTPLWKIGALGNPEMIYKPMLRWRFLPVSFISAVSLPRLLLAKHL